MKRTRAATRIQQGNKIEKDENGEDTITKTRTPTVSERPKLNLKSLRNQNTKNICDTTMDQVVASSKRSKVSQREPKMETHVEKEKEEEELKPNAKPGKGKRRAVVDLQMMKAELSQLEDPPVTPWEKELSSGRLQYEFFDTPCEELAQRLLGKVLVRYLENGTVLKGRIVETEGYLGAIDKASMTYQNKVTPRNLPMYMPPGTIYVYMTYGMYHCFNISSQEGNAHVLIKAVEPLVGLEYMELLRNMRRKDNGREKQIATHATRLKQHELCNNPFKICDAFAIDQDAFDRKLAYACNNLWLESQPFKYRRIDPYIRVASKDLHLTVNKILGVGCAVLLRAVEPLEGLEGMADQRKMKRKTRTDLKPHELCNGPSKLCMAYQLNREHNRYSVCTWKGMWIEDDGALEDIKIVKAARIGIDSYGPEWASKPLRFYVYGNTSVSKRDKKAEMEIL
ncbi:Dna-3-methyladenine glycosylase [Temnothorax longispinosus]|uniref:DNA-3-methyladenine glycosylase II n=1 Tax=Temnothorax longispinosus TaxID=300112 RepID=A0A4S2KQT5_9HYME|nr:Dna-3-methyladenine glycosylase [Temnothorax longispinosus]